MPEADQEHMPEVVCITVGMFQENCYLYACPETLEAVIGDLLRRQHSTLAVAESATGGGLAERVTQVPGSSDYFLGGFVVYNRRMKVAVLGIDEAVIEQYGPVSKEVAELMPNAARLRSGATYALAITGNAGPGTDGPGAPAGTMFVALADASGSSVIHRQFLGDRARVKQFAGQLALDMLRRRLQREVDRLLGVVRDIFATPHPLLRGLKAQIEAAVADFIRALPHRPEHPFLTRRAAGFTFAGAWSSRLKAQGFHASFFVGKTGCIALKPVGLGFSVGYLARCKNPLQKTLSMPADCGPDSIYPGHIQTGANDHGPTEGLRLLLSGLVLAMFRPPAFLRGSDPLAGFGA